MDPNPLDNVYDVNTGATGDINDFIGITGDIQIELSGLTGHERMEEITGLTGDAIELIEQDIPVSEMNNNSDLPEWDDGTDDVSEMNEEIDKKFINYMNEDEINEDSIIDAPPIKGFIYTLPKSYVNRNQTSISSYINKPNVQKIELPLSKYKVKEDYFDINNYNHDYWILDNDFNDDDTNIDLEYRTIIIGILVTEIGNILDQTNINEEDLDDDFNTYLTVAGNGVEYVFNKMMDNKTWTFTPMEKFLWIYLVIACRHEPRAIKYLVNSPYFRLEHLITFDRLGSSCISISCNSTNSIDVISGLNTNRIIKSELLIFKDNKLSPIVYSIFRTDIFKYICETVEDIDDIITSTYHNGYTLFLLACCYNKDVAEYLITSRFMSKEYFELEANDNMNCLIASALFNPELLTSLIESEYCSSTLLEKEHPIYGNVLLTVAKYNRELLPIILQSEYMTAELLNSTMKYNNGISTNILFEICKSNEDLTIIINSEFFDKSILDYTINDTSIYQELLLENPTGLDIFINSRYFSISNMKEDILINFLLLASIKNVKVIEYLINTDQMNQQLLLSSNRSIYKVDNNILQNLITYSNNKDLIESIFNKWNYNELLISKTVDKFKYYSPNVFVYLSVNFPCIACKLLKKEDFDKQILLDKYIDNIPIIYPVICMSINKELINTILDLEYIDETIWNIRDQLSNNLLLNVALYNPTILECLLKNKHCTEEIFNSKNGNDDNILLSLIKRDVPERIIKLVINDKRCNESMINGINKMNETPLILACSKNFDIAKLIMESPLLDMKTLTKYDVNGINCFMQACKGNAISIVKMIGDHKSFTNDIYMKEDKYNQSCIIYSFEGDIDITKYILNHKYNTTEFLNKSIKLWSSNIDIDSRGTLINLIDMIDCILNCKYSNSETLLNMEIQGENIIHHLMDNDIDYIKLIINSKHCSDRLLSCCDTNGETIMMKSLRSDIFNHIIKLPCITTDLLRIQNKKGETVIHKILSDTRIPYENKIVLLDLDTFTGDLLLIEDNDGFIPLNKLVHDINILEYILKKEYCTTGILLGQDRNKQSLMHHIANKDSEDFVELRLLLDSDKCTTKLLELKDNIPF
jgi:hypothetical protein